tara:strand:- start:34 stop:162 length:129 start_codon:yes stop_codon:yes gene_type:complete
MGNLSFRLGISSAFKSGIFNFLTLVGYEKATNEASEDLSLFV